MNENEKILLLKEEVEKTTALVDEIFSFYDQVHTNELKQLGKTRSTAFIIAQIIENYYTCLETLFLRISQFFENSLNREKWHSDLLDKMLLRINGIREPVLSAKTHKMLVEIMRFRHFKRYYFELDYDWEKLDFIGKKFNDSIPLLKNDLKKFCKFLELLQA